MSKAEVRSLLGIAQTKWECELVRYSIFKASGISYTASRKVYGFQNMRDREARIETSVMEAKEICEAIDDLAKTKDLALLFSMGIEVELSESDPDSNTDDYELPPVDGVLDVGALVPVLEAAKYNWFEVLEHVEKELKHALAETPHIMEHLKNLYLEILSKVDDIEKRTLLQQSYYASLVVSEIQESDDRGAAATNGEIVSDSESDTGIPVTSIDFFKQKR